MSILTELMRKKITWAQAKEKAEGWAHQVAGQISPAADAALGEALADVKQAASNAIDLADSLAGPIIAEAADLAGAALDRAAAAYLGPFASVVAGPATHDAINKLRDSLKAELDARALEMHAIIAGNPKPVAHPSPPAPPAS